MPRCFLAVLATLTALSSALTDKEKAEKTLHESIKYSNASNCVWPECAPVCEDCGSKGVGSCMIPGAQMCPWSAKCTLGSCFCRKGYCARGQECKFRTCQLGARPPKHAVSNSARRLAEFGPDLPYNATAEEWHEFVVGSTKWPFLLLLAGVVMGLLTCGCICGHCAWESPIILLVLCILTVGFISFGVVSRPMRAGNGEVLNPRNMMPEMPQTRAESQTMDLNKDREVSSIPKTGETGNWVYPSPQQFYHALLRKNKEAEAETMDAVVYAHNVTNERTPSLLRFVGRQKDLSWGGWWSRLLSYRGVPFDRHDWFIDRCGQRTVRYVIDYYDDPAARDFVDRLRRPGWQLRRMWTAFFGGGGEGAAVVSESFDLIGQQLRRVQKSIVSAKSLAKDLEDMASTFQAVVDDLPHTCNAMVPGAKEMMTMASDKANEKLLEMSGKVEAFSNVANAADFSMSTALAQEWAMKMLVVIGPMVPLVLMAVWTLGVAIATVVSWLSSNPKIAKRADDLVIECAAPCTCCLMMLAVLLASSYLWVGILVGGVCLNLDGNAVSLIHTVNFTELHVVICLILDTQPQYPIFIGMLIPMSFPQSIRQNCSSGAYKQNLHGVLFISRHIYRNAWSAVSITSIAHTTCRPAEMIVIKRFRGGGGEYRTTADTGGGEYWTTADTGASLGWREEASTGPQPTQERAASAYHRDYAFFGYNSYIALAVKQLYTTCRPAERLPPLATGTMPSWATPSCIALAVRQLLRENRRRFTASNLHIVELTARDAKQTLSHALRDAWRGHTWSQFLKSDAKAAEAFRHCNSAQVRQRAHNMMLRWARGGEDRRHLPAITSGHYVSKTRLLFTQRETGHPFPLRLRYEELHGKLKGKHLHHPTGIALPAMRAAALLGEHGEEMLTVWLGSTCLRSHSNSFAMLRQMTATSHFKFHIDPVLEGATRYYIEGSQENPMISMIEDVERDATALYTVYTNATWATTPAEMVCDGVRNLNASDALAACTRSVGFATELMAASNIYPYYDTLGHELMCDTMLHGMTLLVFYSAVVSIVLMPLVAICADVDLRKWEAYKEANYENHYDISHEMQEKFPFLSNLHLPSPSQQSTPQGTPLPSPHGGWRQMPQMPWQH
ncbi:Cytochrome c-type heme lyase [Symbiodinium microadriaticum]|uniref:holocytochrome-c synthase n=1 Tax=Symbiodinium microadriaticum TaxID=2951 RepID=A0A1Q9D0N1_SYMMI|nr:Cytochrome c-type heme lyase [Symbiodinium microadriaticum]